MQWNEEMIAQRSSAKPKFSNPGTARMKCLFYTPEDCVKTLQGKQCQDFFASDEDVGRAVQNLESGAFGMLFIKSVSVHDHLVNDIFLCLRPNGGGHACSPGSV
jgi:hypothetical protein